MLHGDMFGSFLEHKISRVDEACKAQEQFVIVARDPTGPSTM